MRPGGSVFFLSWLFITIACASAPAQPAARSRPPAPGSVAEHSYFFVGGSAMSAIPPNK